MAVQSVTQMLFLSSLLISFHLSRSQLSPNASPESSPEPVSSDGPATAPMPSSSPSSSPSPSPSPAADTDTLVSSRPSIPHAPSESISPSADALSASNEADGPSQPLDDDAPSQQSDDDDPSQQPDADDDPSQQSDADGPSQRSDSDGPDISASLSSDEVDPKLKTICDSTDHPALCLATAIPVLKGKTDVPSVLEVTIKAGTKLANEGLSLAKQLAEKPGTPPQFVSILKDCKDSYDTTVYNYENAMSAFPERDVGTMNSMLSAAITDVGDCEDAYASLGAASPFESLADKLTNMTSNGLAIISLMN